ncbi:aldehyde dehydrogenase family protein [Pseudomonas monteilii]|uniref:Aldehyde dehydrogenase family protein n=1 Tax=Pseudomonas monteilii TaxID=76759 RepID=A0A399MBU9_9PSED|nr:aldehyde dehydrogenase family protein [Pseudomonas monteilii]RII78915.1 aldehyde dehydrogenase family protein [Pseudomonas monteilii]
MAELLSKEQYAAIAAELQLRTKAFIDGEFRDAISGKTFVTTNPATGQQLVEVAACDVNDVNVAVAAAKRVFEEGTWSKMQPNDRKHVLQKFAQLLEDNAPSLAAGCSIVVKPAKETTLSALRVAELAHEAGIPAGVFNLVPGGGREVGEAIGRHMDIPMVSFTGSTDTGRLFLKYAAESNLKRIVLELGGKNPAVVMNDCEDLDEVAQFVTAGAFWNMGENCSASSRLIVHKDVKDELLGLIAKHLKDWKLGDPLDPDNRLGAMVSKSHFEKVKSYLEYAAEQKLSIVQGGETEEGVFVQPTIVDNVGRDNKLFVEEIFGPVLSVTSFETIDEAIELANDTVYGLAASAYTGSLRNALRLSREIRAGVVTVNCFGEGDVTTPFGGYKESGFGGRDKSIWAHDQYTELKTIWINAS